MNIQEGTIGGYIDMEQSGYSLVGVIGFNSGNSGYTLSQISVGANRVYLAARNTSLPGATGTLDVSLYGLYIKK